MTPDSATVIRQAGRRDEAALRECAALAYARYAPRIGREPAPMRADFAALIDAGEVHVATDADGRLQGFVVFRAMEAGYVLLESVAVLPGAAGRGVGRALILFCEDAARRGGAGAVRLYANEKMVENLALYPRLGYAETGRRVEDGFRRVHFEKRLTPA
ncbi:GNAT family N-acetyltransferase [Amaricoccus sp.]|uniref:GNAT family N-acetyltransferase n=1 Tax=Amaricoccus sp. TaxID=1872485 RepID=UPI001B5D8292|nr:GNAT family N-acetyltransferase [Amaricoccus sp.]MBP7243107.1 GNAT family N-acetyltransferase [Amaricoccus sp.]